MKSTNKLNTLTDTNQGNSPSIISKAVSHLHEFKKQKQFLLKLLLSQDILTKCVYCSSKHNDSKYQWD